MFEEEPKALKLINWTRLFFIIFPVIPFVTWLYMVINDYHASNATIVFIIYWMICAIFCTWVDLLYRISQEAKNSSMQNYVYIFFGVLLYSTLVWGFFACALYEKIKEKKHETR